MTGRLAWRPVGLVVLADAALLAATLNGYGYHRDELYFRMLASHPAWGYVDEPPLTPMLAKAGIALLGDNLWGIRVPALLLALAAVALTALLAAELGGGATAQVLAAVGASSTFLFISGHVLLTSTADLVVWLVVILFAARALLRQPRWWLAAGLATGIGLYNKQLVVLLLIGLAVGLLVAGPRRELRSPWLWAGAGTALVVGLPNLVYQIANHWPEATMAHAIARHKGQDDRVFFVPFQLVLIGPPLAPIWIAGLVRLLRDPAWRAVRSLAWAYPVVCVIVLVTGGQPYYTFGLILLLYAAGCVAVARRFSGARRAWTVAALAVNVAVSAVIALPIIPVSSLPPSIATTNQTARDSIGWPTYVRQVADAYHALPPEDRAVAVLFAGNYGEAGALDRYGRNYGLPSVYSGQNELHRFGPPPDSATVVVEVNEGEDLARYFATCTKVGELDNGLGIDNEEQGAAITVCRGRHGSWRDFWADLQHYD